MVSKDGVGQAHGTSAFGGAQGPVPILLGPARKELLAGQPVGFGDAEVLFGCA